MKYYYDCPLKAGYMTQYFDMKFRNWRWDNVEFNFHPVNEYDDECEFLYIHPDSLILLEPQDGDTVQSNGKSDYTGEYADYTKDIYTAGDRSIFTWDENSKIIQRNGKPFFWPEIEV